MFDLAPVAIPVSPFASVGQKPTDIVVACCRDEADIIDGFIDFYISQGFDRICLIDNGSVDGTVDQILAHPCRDRIMLFRDPRPGYDARLFDYYRVFAAPEVRWVFFLDVDEFVPLPGGIKAYAETLPADVTVLDLPTAEMLPNVGDYPQVSPLLSERREARFQKEGKVVWKASANVEKIYCGRHDIVVSPRVAHRDEAIFIRHFHTRSPVQFRSKLRNRIETEEAMGAEVEGLTLFPRETRGAWIQHSRRLLEDDGWELEVRRLTAMETVHDPAVSGWFAEAKASFRNLDFSPVIPLHGQPDGWFCTCARVFRAVEGHTGPEHLVLFYAPGRTVTTLDGGVFPDGATVPVRLHSECIFGDIFSTRRCDCGRQLSEAIRAIEKAGAGVILYLRQEGRGVGLYDKIRSLAVDHEDTFHRNEAVGLPKDARGYQLASEVLRFLGVKKAQLLSGNMDKAAALHVTGIETVLDGSMELDGLAPEARNEIHAKLRKGYNYTLTDGATTQEVDPAHERTS